MNIRKCIATSYKEYMRLYLSIAGGGLAVPAIIISMYPGISIVYVIALSCVVPVTVIALCTSYCFGYIKGYGCSNRGRYRYKNISINAAIDSFGNVTSNQTRTVETFSNVNAIWFSDGTAEGQCRSFTKYDVDSSLSRSNSLVKASYVMRSGGKAEGVFELFPSIIGGSEFDLNICFKRGGAIPMTFDEVRSTIGQRLDFPNEAIAFMSYVIPSGVEVFECKYVFPRGFVPGNIKARVCHRKELSEQETERARAGFFVDEVDGAFVIKWKVVNPLQEHGYFVTWVPPKTWAPMSE